ncbi:uncharacterized protein [Rutidosis leptorrhynchoides]|uniref:uncharacterized protein n=1 Tax=Rutidosis leptorrhynchoides TaxID=125765 RepID=UPI003A99A2DD
MGKKGGWFSAVRKAFVVTNNNNDSKEKKEKKPLKTASKKTWFGKQKNEADSSHPETAFATPALHSPPPETEDDLKFAEPEAETSKLKEQENESNRPKEPENEPSKSTEPEDEPSKPTKEEIEQKKPAKQENEQNKPAKQENEQKKIGSKMAYATSRAAVAAAAFRRFLGKSKEEVAAIKVQTAFRRFSARRKLRALKGLVRLRVLVQSQSVKRQAVTTLRCMQTLARVQSQVRARRIRMSEENQALQRQLMQKRERELDNMRSMGTEWDNTRRSKEQIEASLQNKEEAAARRERALAYAQTQQQMWRNPSKSSNPTFMDPNNPQWGWSWLDRWMAARPWESQNPIDNEQPPGIKLTRSSSVGDVSKRLEHSTSISSPRSPSVSSSRQGPPSSPKFLNEPTPSPRNRRHSISSSSFREVSSPRVSSPRGVSSPRSTKTKSMIPTPTQGPSPNRSPSPSPLGSAKKGTTEKKSTGGTVKKRLSLSGAQAAAGAARRLSGSARVGPGSR